MRGADVSTAPLHHVLLRMAGWAPDELLSAARTWLGRGHTGEAAAIAAHAAVSCRIPLAGADLNTLASALTAEGHEPGPLLDLGAPAVPALPPVRLFADGPVDGVIDELCLRTLQDYPEVTARSMWRVCRSPLLVTPWPETRAVYLAQVEANEDLLAVLTVDLQEVLEGAGEYAPQVEVFAALDELAPYHRTALCCADLLWSARPVQPMRVAAPLRPLTALAGPGLPSDWTPLDGADRERALTYLSAGTPVLATSALMDDVLDSSNNGVVPMGYRTDGTWVWSDATRYYLRQHGVPPQPDLLDHIRAGGSAVEPGDAVATHRALAALRESGVETWPGWR